MSQPPAQPAPGVGQRIDFARGIFVNRLDGNKFNLFPRRREKRRAWPIRSQTGWRGTAKPSGFPDAPAGNRIANRAAWRRSFWKCAATSSGSRYVAATASRRNCPCGCRRPVCSRFFRRIQKNPGMSSAACWPSPSSRRTHLKPSSRATLPARSQSRAFAGIVRETDDFRPGVFCRVPRSHRSSRRQRR